MSKPVPRPGTPEWAAYAAEMRGRNRFPVPGGAKANEAELGKRCKENPKSIQVLWAGERMLLAWHDQGGAARGGTVRRHDILVDDGSGGTIVSQPDQQWHEPDDDLLELLVRAASLADVATVLLASLGLRAQWIVNEGAQSDEEVDEYFGAVVGLADVPERGPEARWRVIVESDTGPDHWYVPVDQTSLLVYPDSDVTEGQALDAEEARQRREAADGLLR